MKKTIFLGIITALSVFTSCTTNDVMNEGDVRLTNTISFNTGLSTSRTLNSTDDLTKFFVYGVQDASNVLFNHQEVNRDTEGWSYNYAGGDKPMWVAGSKYKFYAYSAENADLAGHVNFDIEKGLTFSEIYVGAVDSNFDLVYADPVEQVGKMTGNARVPFKFHHILSQINIVFNNATDNASDVPYDVTITRVKINGYELRGDFDGTDWIFEDYSSVLPGAGHVPLLFKDTNKETSNTIALGESQQTAPLHVIPQTPYALGDVVSIRFTYTITNRNDATDTVSKSYAANLYPEWKKGYRYNYTVNVSLHSLENIEFTAESLDDWSDATSAELIQLTELNLGDY